MVANSRIRTSSSNYGHTEHDKGAPTVTTSRRTYLLEQKAK